MIKKKNGTSRIVKYSIIPSGKSITIGRDFNEWMGGKKGGREYDFRQRMILGKSSLTLTWLLILQ